MPPRLTAVAMFWTGLVLALVSAMLLALPPLRSFSVTSDAQVWVLSLIGLTLQAVLFVGAGLVAGSVVLRSLQR